MNRQPTNSPEQATVTQHLMRALIPILILGIGVGAMFALGNRRQETREPDDGGAVPEVRTEAVLPHRGGLDIEVDGVVEPFRELAVAAEVAGRIRFKADVCRAGCFVQRGTPLVEIDPGDYELERQRTRGLYDQAVADLEELDVEIENIESLVALAQQDLALQQKELQRLLGLRNGVTATEVDQARRAVVQSENALQTLQNQLRSARVRRTRLEIAQKVAKSQWDKAERDLQRTEIRAPVDGVIVGDQVEQDAFVQPGTVLFTIEDTSSVEVRCNLKMEELYWLWRQPDAGLAPAGDGPGEAYRVPHTPATVYYQFAGRKDLRFAWRGILSRYDGIGLDERTRTVPCRIVVDQPTEVTAVDQGSGEAPARRRGPPALVRGMYVTALIHARPDATFLRVPETALQPGKRVWRVRDGKLEHVGPLPLVKYCGGPESNGIPSGFWLTPAGESGLAAGDRLVVSPVVGARDGMPVRERGDKQAAPTE